MDARPRAATALALLPFFGLLGGCGGGDQAESSGMPTGTPSASLEAPAAPMTTAQMQARRLPYIQETLQAAAQRSAATAEEAQWIVQDETGASPGSFTLAPEFGKGYAPLRITMHGRRVGDTEGPAPVRPVCTTATRCEFRLQGLYSVEVNDPDVQLTPRDDIVAFSVRALQVEKTRTVTIRFLREGQIVSMREVVLLGEAEGAVTAADTSSSPASLAGIGSVKRLAYLK